MIEMLLVLWFSFHIVKATANAIDHDYYHWKEVLCVPDSWDWYCNPDISWANKYKSWLWGFLTPVSDLWHTVWTLWQFYFVAVLIVLLGWLYGSIASVVGVFVVFNGLYNFYRRRRFL